MLWEKLTLTQTQERCCVRILDAENQATLRRTVGKRKGPEELGRNSITGAISKEPPEGLQDSGIKEVGGASYVAQRSIELSHVLIVQDY